MKKLITVIAACILIGCSSISERNIYEGIQSQQKIKDVGNNEKKQTLPTYEQYEQERKNR